MEIKKKIIYLDSLQIYRAIAVLLVIIHHNVASIKNYHSDEFELLNFIGDIGKYGVDFFFILSGFIIAYTTKFKLHKLNGFKDYLKSRIIRIYVPYLPIGIALLLLYNLFPSFSNSGRDISTVTSLTLLPDGKPALSVAWTLTFEIIFYIFYSLRFFGKKIFRIVLFSWLGIILFSQMFLYDSIWLNDNAWVKTLTSLYNIEFFIGILLAYLFYENKRINKNIVVLLSIVFCFGFLYVMGSDLKYYHFLSNTIFSVFVALAVYYTIFYTKTKLSSKNILMIIGNASYSIYLTHNNVQALLVRFFPKIGIELRVFLMLISALLICCLIGYIYSRIFEVRLTKFIKKMLA